MASETSSKINQLLKKWPSGAVAVLPWLEKQGVYQQLAHEYEKTSWLCRVGRGAYTKAGDRVEWTGGLYAIQEQMGLSIHAGGKTALQVQGYAHFLPLRNGAPVSLFGLPDVKLPAWFKQSRWNVKVRYVTTNLFTGEANQGLTKKEMGFYSVRLSTPERAIMEVLYRVPKEETYEEARLLMEELTTLRPRLVQTLLEHCNSVKVKRLFMVLAESCQHAWVKKLDLSKVNFGKGKRMIVKGGQFDPRYNICVPKHGGQREKKAPHAKSGATVTRGLSSTKRTTPHRCQNRGAVFRTGQGHRKPENRPRAAQGVSPSPAETRLRRQAHCAVARGAKRHPRAGGGPAFE